MQRPATTRLITFALLSSAWLAGAGPEGCGPVAPTHPLPPDPEPPVCTAPACDLYCANGFATDENGCEICACNPPVLCMADADCSIGQACDLSVCLSPCDGREDGAACPAVCYGQCLPSTPEPSCDPSAPNACGEGYACVCSADDGGLRAPPGPGDQAPPEDPYPRPESCACVPVEPPPPSSCDANDPNGVVCPDGWQCVCTLTDCGPDVDCGASEPQCSCYPPPAETCDPTSPICPEGFECVCAMGDTRDCAGDRCGIPTPVECYCVPPPPPPPTSCSASDPNAPVCAPGEECICFASTEPAAPCDAEGCGDRPAPPPSECFCVAPPPPPSSCDPSDPSAPVCGPDQDCLCTGSSGGGACDPDDPTCLSAPPLPVEECVCVDREPLSCSSSSDCRPGETCWVPIEGCFDFEPCGRCAP